MADSGDLNDILGGITMNNNTEAKSSEIMPAAAAQSNSHNPLEDLISMSTTIPQAASAAQPAAVGNLLEDDAGNEATEKVEAFNED